MPHLILDLPASRLIVDRYNYNATIKEDIASADLVISHAGAGTCLEGENLRRTEFTYTKSCSWVKGPGYML